MAKPNKLKEIEEQYGDPLVVIPQKVNELGSLKAAANFFGVSDSTIVVFMNSNGYRRVCRWIKEGESHDERPQQQKSA